MLCTVSELLCCTWAWLVKVNHVRCFKAMKVIEQTGVINVGYQGVDQPQGKQAVETEKEAVSHRKLAGFSEPTTQPRIPRRDRGPQVFGTGGQRQLHRSPPRTLRMGRKERTLHSPSSYQMRCPNAARIGGQVESLFLCTGKLRHTSFVGRTPPKGDLWINQ